MTPRPQWDAITEKIGVDKQKAVYAGLGREVRRLSAMSVRQSLTPSPRPSRRSGRR